MIYENRRKFNKITFNKNRIEIVIVGGLFFSIQNKFG